MVSKPHKEGPSGPEVLCMEFGGRCVTPQTRIPLEQVWNDKQPVGRLHSPQWESQWKGGLVSSVTSKIPLSLLILSHVFFFLIFFIPFPVWVLARTHIIRSLSFLCESLIEQAAVLPCHKIFFHLRTQKNLWWTQRTLTCCPPASRSRNYLRERVRGQRKEERKGCFHSLHAQGSSGQVSFEPSGQSHETFYFVPSGAVEEAEWRFITTVVHSSPTGLALCFSEQLLDIPTWVEMHKNFSLETTRCFCRGINRWPKGDWEGKLGAGRKMVLLGAHVFLPAPTGPSPWLAYLYQSQTPLRIFLSWDPTWPAMPLRVWESRKKLTVFSSQPEMGEDGRPGAEPLQSERAPIKRIYNGQQKVVEITPSLKLRGPEFLSPRYSHLQSCPSQNKGLGTDDPQASFSAPWFNKSPFPLSIKNTETDHKELTLPLLVTGLKNRTGLFSS